MALKLSRRGLLGGLGGLGALGLAGCAAVARPHAAAPAADSAAMPGIDHSAGMAHALGNILVGDVDPAVNGFDPMAMLTDFDGGEVSTLPSGQTLREYQIYAADKLIQVAPGISFNALFAAVFLALGAGAIAQVVYEVGRLIVRQSREEGAPLLSPATFGGLAAGVLVMYATALLVAA